MAQTHLIPGGREAEIGSKHIESVTGVVLHRVIR